MKCFVHKNEEARCICMKCGKAMCIDCSAQLDHSGLCPNCLLNTYRRRRDLRIGIIAWVTLAAVSVPFLLMHWFPQINASILWTIDCIVTGCTWLLLIKAIKYNKMIKILRKSLEQGSKLI